jgi:DNA (cytosine-5)-methyltransferase 1
MSKLKVLSLFSGIGAFEKALTNKDVDFEVVGFSDIDKYTVQSYCAIHNVDESLNLGDVSAINTDELPDFDLLVGGSPCQNISKCGNVKGLKGDESKLFYDYARILNDKLPKYFIFENVDNLLQVNDGEDWKIVSAELSKNYKIKSQVLDSKYYNIPQSRKRLFVVGVRNDIDEEFNFTPSLIPTSLTMNDIMDEDAAESLSITNFNGRYDEIIENNKVVSVNKGNKIKKVGNIYPKNGQNGNIYSPHGLSPTLRSGQGVVGNGIGSNNAPKVLLDDGTVRKLSSKECWRLMGFSDADYENCVAKNVSATQLYKQSGNAIVVNVIESIVDDLLK